METKDLVPSCDGKCPESECPHVNIKDPPIYSICWAHQLFVIYMQPQKKVLTHGAIKSITFASGLKQVTMQALNDEGKLDSFVFYVAAIAMSLAEQIAWLHLLSHK